eukprot:scaffold1816_cov134-Isochrysis_galbana.AAC.5
MLEIQVSTTKCQLREPARACQSLAHHTTLTGRCPNRKAQETRKQCHTGSCPTLQSLADDTRARINPRLRHHLLERADPTSHYPIILSRRGENPTADRARRPQRGSKTDCTRPPPSPTYVTHQKTHKLTPLHPHPSQKGKGKAPPPPPRPPPIEEVAPEEGDDPNFISDTNNLITIKQKGPTLREIRDTDMGAAITYLLLDLEGVDTEPDILDDGKKGTRERSGATHPQRLINRTNHTISPLFSLDAEGTLSMSEQMAKRPTHCRGVRPRGRGKRQETQLLNKFRS